MSQPVRIVLTITGMVLYGFSTATRTLVPVGVLPINRRHDRSSLRDPRDGTTRGISLNRMVMAALKQRLSPQH